MPLNVTASSTTLAVENGVPVAVSLGEHEITELILLNETWRHRLNLSRDPFVYEHGFFSARDVTGFIQIGGHAIEIAPKFLSDGLAADPNWRAAVWSILARTYRAPSLAGLSTGALTSEHFLPDLLGYVLLTSTRSAMLQGWPSGYTEVSGRQSVLKGRIVPGRILDALLYPGLVFCEYEEFSRDVAPNRLVKWAAEQLSHLVRSPILGRDLMDEACAFEGVSSNPPPIQLAERISLSPLNQALAPAVRVGQLLLGGRNVRHGEGAESLPAFLWNSSDVFERFMKVLVRRATNFLPDQVRFNDSALILGEPVFVGRRLRTTPDIRLVAAGSTVVLLDAKYKVWSGSPIASDSYQVVTGGWVSGSNHVGLIYPSPSPGRKRPISWSLMGHAPPRRLWAVFVDLVRMAEHKGEDQLIRELVSDLRMIREAPNPNGDQVVAAPL